jgi:hypothetical protein
LLLGCRRELRRAIRCHRDNSNQQKIGKVAVLVQTDVENVTSKEQVMKTGSIHLCGWKHLLFGASLLALCTPMAPAQSPGPSSNITVFATGLNNPRGLKFGPDGNLYVAEGGAAGTNSTVGQCTGKVVRVDHPGGGEEIASSVTVPSAMTFGPDGNLYVSNVGFGPPPIGLGQVVKIAVP